jgi:tRNA U34 5-methylaminomethyl-2-thiouridine-forming methyltransferase MnmC
VPVSKRFDDPYFSLEDGLAETCHVFLQGNDLPNRFRNGYRIAELGFGTGLNFLATMAAWETSRQSGGFLFTSFEAFPLQPEDMSKALSAFAGSELQPEALMRQWTPTGGLFQITPFATLEVIVGDARVGLPAWHGQADAWYLDGFSPAKNPELWSPELMTAVAAHTAPGGTFATYTAAGAVRRGLEAAGFKVERVPGFGRKRHMTRGTLRA